MHAATTRFLGLDFQPMMAPEAASRIAGMASRNEAFTYVVTPNVDHRIRLEREPQLRPLYEDAGLMVNDSRILEVLAKADGIALPAAPGADIVQLLFEHHIRPDEPVTIIGADAGIETALRQRFGLTRTYRHAPPMGLRHKPEAIAAAAAFIAAHPARFHFLCVGSPQQEMVAHAAAKLGTATGIGLCCGASLDFLSGRTARAPGWMRSARLEWLHRLGSQPRRLARRYLVDGPAIFGIWRRSRRA
ncbi:MAG: WecB/TagA/CpsF family glycosyltransferase [Hyphomonas sp.]|nr:WecB/TagA/CpsF family glycosyltransferase [Hyphomonas sp.]